MFCVALTWSGCFDVDRLEAPVQCWGVDDVRVKVTVGLAVDKESHDDGDDQAHNYSDYNAHVQRHIICTRSGWRGHKKEEREIQMLLDTKHLLKMICISERKLLKFSWNIRTVAESNEVFFFKVGQDEMFIRLQIINFRFSVILSLYLTTLLSRPTTHQTQETTSIGSISNETFK